MCIRVDHCYCSFLNVWRFNPLFYSPIFNISEDMRRRIKYKGTGKEGTDANQLHLALCSISTQRTVSVRILHNPGRSNIMIGIVHLANLFQIGGFQNGHWHINQNYQLTKCLDHELDEEFNGKIIPEGAPLCLWGSTTSADHSISK